MFSHRFISSVTSFTTRGARNREIKMSSMLILSLNLEDDHIIPKTRSHQKGLKTMAKPLN
nr:MAG TPA: hypothetical protein [Caudoviricetes sp.]